MPYFPPDIMNALKQETEASRNERPPSTDTNTTPAAHGYYKHGGMQY